MPLSTTYKWRARALAAFQKIVLDYRRDEAEKRPGGSALALIPLDLAVLFAAFRDPGVQLDPTPSFSGWTAPSLGPLGFGMGTPPVVAPALLGAAALALWMAPQQPHLEAPLARQVAPIAAQHVAAARPAALSPPAPAAAPAAPAPRAAAPRHPRPPAPPLPAASPAPEPVELPAADRDLALLEACHNLVIKQDANGALQCLFRHGNEVPDSRFVSERASLWERAQALAGERDRASPRKRLR
jgi:hypothetical protein